jgi:hypothetical protein
MFAFMPIAVVKPFLILPYFSFALGFAP